MADIDALLADLVTASRILAHEGICDAFGHISVRNPDDPSRFFLARAIAPELVTRDDILQFELDGTAVDDDRKPFLERFIHGTLMQARPDIQSVVHSHSRGVIPFGVTGTPIRPLLHSCGVLGTDVPVWDANDAFGDTNLLISSNEMGADFARTLGGARAALMRGHGSTVVGRSIREAVYSAVYLDVNAQLQAAAMQIGTVKYLTDGEISLIQSRLADAKPDEGYDRAWQYWARRADASRA
ncbi:MAG: class II aldolase/adducin family protein [Rhodobacteraceae bacterium]|nr:class II aldolase/adducin family protein [Paracoccaceae bacterium]